VIKWFIRLFLVEVFHLIREYMAEYNKTKQDREINKGKVDAFKNAKSLNEALSSFDNLP